MGGYSLVSAPPPIYASVWRKSSLPSLRAYTTVHTHYTVLLTLFVTFVKNNSLYLVSILIHYPYLHYAD